MQVWDVMRGYCMMHPPVGSAKRKTSDAARAILAKAARFEADFTPSEVRHCILCVQSSFVVTAWVINCSLYACPQDLCASKHKVKVARYPQNPEPNWGPKRRAGTNKTAADAKVPGSNSTTDNENSAGAAGNVATLAAAALETKKRPSSTSDNINNSDNTNNNSNETTEADTNPEKRTKS